MKRTIRENLSAVGVKSARRSPRGCSLWTPSTAANVINASFNSSSVPLQTSLFAYEPSERASKEAAAVVLASWSQNCGLRATL